MMKELILTERQEKLLEFVKEQHGSQLRKYTNEPYWTHPLSVAKRVAHLEVEIYNIIEIALCHDLFEDTTCDFYTLDNKLLEIGYTSVDSRSICLHVNDLTDVYTPESYPNLNRAKRKLREAERLSRIYSTAQTVKYADLIDNTSSIVQFDPGFAVKYLEEKKDILKNMRNGDFDLFIECCWTLKNAMEELKIKDL